MQDKAKDFRSEIVAQPCCEQSPLLRSALEHMEHALCMFDADRRIVLCNRRYAQVVGLPEEKIRPGLSSAELIRMGMEAGYFDPEESADELVAQMWRNLTCDPNDRAPLKRNGRSFAVHTALTQDGYLIATFEDIALREEAEQALRESEARSRAILDSMPDCVKIFDEFANLVYINSGGLDLLQAPDQQALSKPGYLAVPPEYLHTLQEMHARVLEGEAVAGTYEVIGLKGRRRHVEARSVPFRLPGGGKAHMCISRDVQARKEAEDQLRRSEERLRLVQEATGLAGFEAGPDGVTTCTQQFIEQIGLPADKQSLTFEELLDIVHPEDRDRVVQEIISSLKAGDVFQSEFRIRRVDTGEVRWVASRTKIIRDEDGNAVQSIGAHLDITERKWSESALKESEERFRLAAEAAGLGVWDFDPGANRREWSKRLLEIFGLDAEVTPSLELAARCICPEDRDTFVQALEKIRDDDATERFDAHFRASRMNDGARRWIAMNGFKARSSSGQTRIILTVRDITDAKTAEEKVLWTARHDALTGLANRASFQAQLIEAIESNDQVGLFMLDLDHFKQINDALGHDAGDELLKMFADRLTRTVRKNDIVARLGGDEFAIIIPGAMGGDDLDRLAAAIHQRLRLPFVYEGRVLDCRTSIGATAYPNDGLTPKQLLKNADLALYAAKASGRATTKYFKPDLQEDTLRHSAMVRVARKAVQENRVVPHYQPKLDLQQGTIVGFEALLRWRDGEGQLHLPATIEAAFEDHDVAADLSDRMIQGTISDIRTWLERDVPFGHVAVNASAAEFRRDNFAERVLEALSGADMPKHLFQLEVRETVFLGRGADYVRRALALLHAEGVRIALDDFGTGHASLRHLKQFPVDSLKIDQSFIRNMQSDPSDEAIIRAVVHLGKSLGITVVAEGIEHQEQARRLMELGCDQGQGFFFAPAVSGDRLPQVVRSLSGRQIGAPFRHGAKDLRLISAR